MKLNTTQTVSVTYEEAMKFLTKYIEKKTGKKVIPYEKNDGDPTFVFSLVSEETDLDEKASA
jgi:hypothetical protein